MKSFLLFLKKEIVFCMAFLCAVISAFFVPPSKSYLNYIDWNTLLILFALMGVVCAMRSSGIFDEISGVVCSKVRSVRSLSLSLILLSFFTSMFITNDVALLTLVPFSLAILSSLLKDDAQLGKTAVLLVVLETIGANTGSMLTPLGNPQNLFLFSKMQVNILTFIKIIAPYSALSLLFLIIASFFIPQKRIRAMRLKSACPVAKKIIFRWILYAVLFAVCILSVARIFPKWASAALVFCALLFFDRKALFAVDYMLLLTFAAFFIFTGNIASVPVVRDFFMKAVAQNEFYAALFSSQIISNVPATLLLYPFALDTKSLLLGVNIGGLGTLVASLASLISFKLYSGARKNLGCNELSGQNLAASSASSAPSAARYLLVFTLLNVALLLCLCGMRLFLVGK